MAKAKGTKGQTMIHKQTKTLHRRLKIEQHEPPLKTEVNAGVPEV